MSTTRPQPDHRRQQSTPQQAPGGNVPALAGPRLPYHPAIEERFGIDRSSWKALVEAIFPGAQSTESVILALSYCRARKLDPFKRNVHIVPIWDKAKGRLVDTVWPGVGELRTTAFRTGVYAGRDKTEFGEMIENEWPVTDKNGKQTGTVKLKFPMWAQVTVYRMVKGQRVAFQGPQVYWMETFSSNKGGEPNSMWQKRPSGQLDKCAEAAALRAAFPEELGDDYIDSEAGMIIQHGAGAQQGVQSMRDVTPRPQRADFAETTGEIIGEDAEAAGEDATTESAGTASAEDDARSTAHSSDPEPDQAQAEPQDQQTAPQEAPQPDAGPAAEGDQRQSDMLDDQPSGLQMLDRALGGIANMGALKAIVAKHQPWIDTLDGLDLTDVQNVIARHEKRIQSAGRR